MKLFTEVPLAEITEMSMWEGADLNKAKKILADETTALLHGRDCLEKIHATAATLFAGGGQSLDSLPKILLDPSDVSVVRESGISLVDLLIRAEFATSKAEAKRMIKAGSARINDEKVVDESALVTFNKFDENGNLKLSSGKKKHAVITLR